MRAYITVIRDSFHEAFASRVLYLLLLAMTVVLASLAPLGYREQRSLTFQAREIYDWPVFLKELQRQAQGDEPSPGKRIAEFAQKPLSTILLDPAFSKDLSPNRVNEIVEGLNSLLAERSLYDAVAWQGVRLRDATQKLLKDDRTHLSQEEASYLNRLLLRDAFPSHLGAIADKQLHMTYAWWTLPEPVPGGLAWFPQVVKIALAAFMNIFVGTVAVFVAVLVTAPIVPRTFEPGAIDLLLSKPISRSLLTIAKYVGGCSFILLSAGYFITGLWLIVGFRLDVWSGKLLLCIPVFMFQFAIYYAVSMLAGVIWRNAIVCIVVTVLFYLACFTVGNADLAIDRTYIAPYQLVQLVPAKDGWVGVNRQGQFVQWNEAIQNWTEVLRAVDQRGPRPLRPVVTARLIGPVYHRPTESLLYVKPAPQGPPRRLLGQGSEFVTARWSGSWNPETGPPPPSGTSWIFQDTQADVVLVGAAGVFAYSPSTAPTRPRPKILGIELPLKSSRDPFVRIGPPEAEGFPFLYSAAIAPGSRRLLVDTEQSLTLLKRDGESAYVVERRVDHEPEGPTLLGLTDEYAIVVAKTGEVQLRDPSTLKPERGVFPAGDSPPLAVETSESGQFVAVLFHNGVLWLYDVRSRQGSVLDRHATAVALDGNSLAYANSERQVRIQDLNDGKTVGSYSPSLDTMSWYHRWLIHPLYVVFPKPGELGSVVSSLITEDQILMPIGQGVEDLRDDHPVSQNKALILHGAIFIAAMLAITCLYVERIDL
jgi:hypothetical protein